LLAQLVEKLGRLRQRLHRIEGIQQAAFVRRSRHELRNPLRAVAAARHRPHRIGLKAALLPDHARKELQRQVRFLCRRLDHQAHRLARIALAHIIGWLLDSCRAHPGRLAGVLREGAYTRGQKRHRAPQGAKKPASWHGRLQSGRAFGGEHAG
jgi:hypothetical protein